MSVPFQTSLKKYPFAKLLLALLTGIILEWYSLLPLDTLIIIISLSWVVLFGFSFFPLTKKVTFRWLQGAIILFIVLVSGSMLTYFTDIRHSPDWFGNYQQSSLYILISLKDAPEQKPKSYKAIATVDAVLRNGKWQKTSG